MCVTIVTAHLDQLISFDVRTSLLRRQIKVGEVAVEVERGVGESPDE